MFYLKQGNKVFKYFFRHFIKTIDHIAINTKNEVKNTPIIVPSKSTFTVIYKLGSHSLDYLIIY